jgi:hypothetical protein
MAYAKGTYGVIVTLEQSKEYGRTWLEEDPAMKKYFAWHSKASRSRDPLYHFMSERMRGGTTYCSSCNSLFQGLSADMGKAACFDFAERCYVGDLAHTGARSVAFIHDEILAEAPEKHGHEVAMALRETMEATARVWCPDVWPEAEPAMMRRWTKAAEPVFDAQERLIPWEDREKAA